MGSIYGKPQREHFIQKGGQKFFLVRILLFIIRIIFFMDLKDFWPFFDEIRPGQFVGKLIHVIKELKILFSARRRANLNLFSLERGDVDE